MFHDTENMLCLPQQWVGFSGLPGAGSPVHRGWPKPRSPCSSRWRAESHCRAGSSEINHQRRCCGGGPKIGVEAKVTILCTKTRQFEDSLQRGEVIKWLLSGLISPTEFNNRAKVVTFSRSRHLIYLVLLV